LKAAGEGIGRRSRCINLFFAILMLREIRIVGLVAFDILKLLCLFNSESMALAANGCAETRVPACPLGGACVVV
jgi:hypothetical protein